jgi:hypothetical protein
MLRVVESFQPGSAATGKRTAEDAKAELVVV